MDTTTKQKKDVPIAGMITEKKGDFSLENVPMFGNFHLKITAIGYKPYDEKVAFDLKRGATQGGDMQQALAGVDKDLGNIKLEADAQTLEQVTVTASKPLVSLGIDRKVYNVEKDISASGGTGVDVMKNVPSVAVDIDGNVTLRNSSPPRFLWMGFLRRLPWTRSRQMKFSLSKLSPIPEQNMMPPEVLPVF